MQTWVIAYIVDIGKSMTISNGDFNVAINVAATINLNIKFTSASAIYTTTIATQTWTFIQVALDSSTNSGFAYTTNILGTYGWLMNLQNNPLFFLSGPVRTSITIQNTAGYTGAIRTLALFTNYQTITQTNISYIVNLLNPDYTPWIMPSLNAYFDFSKARDNGIANVAPYGIWNSLTYSTSFVALSYNSICSPTVSSITCTNNCTTLLFQFAKNITFLLSYETITPSQSLCYNLFTKQTADQYFGDYYTCLVNGSKFEVNIGNNWALTTGNTLNYHEGSLNLADSPFSILDPNAIISQNYNSNTATFLSIASLPLFIAQMSFNISLFHTNCSLCHDFVISLININGLANRLPTYLGYRCSQVQANANLSLYTSSQASINTFLTNLISSWSVPLYTVTIPASYFIQNGNYTFTVEMHNFLYNSAIQSASVFIRPVTSPELNVTIQAAQICVAYTVYTDGYAYSCPVFRRNVTMIRAEAQIRNSCISGPVSSAGDFEYTFENISPSSVNLSPNAISINTYKDFSIAAYSMQVGGLYNYLITATLKANSSIIVRQIISLVVQTDQVRKYKKSLLVNCTNFFRSKCILEHRRIYYFW